ncbi:MAG TPA: cytochrome P450, partial [Stellaceae bacterium]|nr:cytochrome P450 [Stellaceae bacterium]
VEAGIRSFVAASLDRLSERDSFDAVADFGRQLSAHILLGLLLDLPPEDWSIFEAISQGLGEFANLPPGAPPPAHFLEIWERGRTYCDALIEARRRAPGTDLVGNIIAAHDQVGKISTEELYATFIILYAGGLGSIVSYIGWTLWRLARDPEQLQLVQRNPERVADALAESLRTDPVGYTALRYATQEAEFAGLRLLPGMPVILIEGATNYDPRVYEDPIEFDLRRAQKREVLSFGSGVHRCIGASLARMSARIAVGAMVERFPRLRLADPGFWPEIVGGPKERAPASVPLRID